ncbi:hypothetical protein Taro_018931 [Colocasia esculenta]|uniref:Uncharacterized protein n=1 Tax=Colocasia esculenta TaxID=4460 RepID=A0A843UVA1_COLES|nr:hypothetical protein [Colocasia esculenta]
MYTATLEKLEIVNESRRKERQPALTPKQFMDMNSIKLADDQFSVRISRYQTEKQLPRIVGRQPEMEAFGEKIIGVDLMEYIGHIMNNFHEEPKDWITFIQAVEKSHSLLVWITI